MSNIMCGLECDECVRSSNATKHVPMSRIDFRMEANPRFFVFVVIVSSSDADGMTLDIFNSDIILYIIIE